MTRVLSELLSAREPDFRHGISRLEQASGGPNNDIKLSSRTNAIAMAKLRELGLDPHNTTGQELYAALMERAKRDDQQLKSLLSSGTDSQDLAAQARQLVSSLDIPRQCFALKSVAIKKIFREHPPKKAMTQLGYRSLESVLKHEPIHQLYAAAWICEASGWQKSVLTAFKQLSPNDFEVRSINIVTPNSKRWEKLASDYVARQKHNILSFKELGAIVLLPLDSNLEGMALAMISLVLHDINDIRSTSTYLKLHQVRPDFGAIVAHAVRHEAYTQASLAGQPLPWRLVHRYFALHEDAYSQEVFEPHVQPEDLTMAPAAEHLAKLHPSFDFWQDTSHVGFLHNKQAVSLNLLDTALSFCNKLPYEQRIVHYFRDHLRHELLLGYLHEQQLAEHLQEQLADELIEPAP